MHYREVFPLIWIAQTGKDPCCLFRFWHLQREKCRKGQVWVLVMQSSGSHNTWAPVLFQQNLFFFNFEGAIKSKFWCCVCNNRELATGTRTDFQQIYFSKVSIPNKSWPCAQKRHVPPGKKQGFRKMEKHSFLFSQGMPMSFGKKLATLQVTEKNTKTGPQCMSLME